MAEKTRRVIVEHRKGSDAPSVVKQKPTANVDFGDGGKLPAGIKLGKTVTVTLTGRITSADVGGRYGMGPSIRMDVTSCSCDHGIGGDLASIKDKRTMGNNVEEGDLD